MSLYKDPVTTLLEVIERENGVVLDPADYDFSAPTPATPVEGSGASYNTVITVSANNVAAPYAGDIDLYYNRLDLADLATMVNMDIRSPASTTTHDLIPSLNRRFGLNLSTSDIILRDTVDNGGYKLALLEAEPTSIGWIGSIEVSVMEGDLLLEDHLLQPALDGLFYPTEYPTKMFAQFYSYWRDFSAHYDYLITLTEGDPITLDLVSVLGDITGDPWIGAGQGEYSLAYAQIIFAGSTATSGEVNGDYDFALIIRLDLDACTSMTGDLVIHFSQPEDPNAIA